MNEIQQACCYVINQLRNPAPSVVLFHRIMQTNCLLFNKQQHLWENSFPLSAYVSVNWVSLCSDNGLSPIRHEKPVVERFVHIIFTDSSCWSCIVSFISRLNWFWVSAKPLPEPVAIKIYDTQWHHQTTMSQWDLTFICVVNKWTNCYLLCYFYF